jgi:hypothetical protein
MVIQTEIFHHGGSITRTLETKRKWKSTSPNRRAISGSMNTWVSTVYLSNSSRGFWKLQRQITVSTTRLLKKGKRSLKNHLWPLTSKRFASLEFLYVRKVSNCLNCLCFLFPRLPISYIFLIVFFPESGIARKRIHPKPRFQRY